MISNRFGHSAFPKSTSFINGDKENRKTNIRHRLRVSKAGNSRSSSSDESEPNNSGHIGGTKIPLEGIELLLNRDKVPNDLGKKMDSDKNNNLEASKQEHIERDKSRFLRSHKHHNERDDGLIDELNDIISDAESVVDDRHPRRRNPRIRRHRDRESERKEKPTLSSFFPKSKERVGSKNQRFTSDRQERELLSDKGGQEGYDSGNKSDIDDDNRSVGSDVSASSGEIRAASGSDLDSVSGSYSESETDDSQDQESGGESSSESAQDKERRWRPPSRMSREEILAEKEKLLYQYGRLTDNGYRTGIRLTMKTPLETLRAEVFRLEKLRSVQRSIRFQRNMLISFASGVEYCNTRFNPYKFALTGWSGELLDNIGDYDQVFEELHHKYNDSVQMAPELRLIAMVGGSGLMFHLSNTLFKSSTPQMQDVLANNPQLMAQVQAAALNQMASQHSNDPIFGMMMGGVGMQNEQRMQGRPTFSQAGQAPPPRTSFNRSQAVRPGPSPANMSSNVGAAVDEVPSGQGIMKGPEGVDDILAQLNGVEAANVGLVSDVEEEIEPVREINTRASGSTKQSRKPRARSRKKNNVIDLDM